MPLSKKQEDGLSLLSLIDGFRQDLSSAWARSRTNTLEVERLA